MILSNTFKTLLLIAISVNVGYARTVAHHGNDTIIPINPPVNGFYAKYLDCDGIPIRSAAIVSDSALYIAEVKIRLMLKQMPAAHANLVMQKVELHIIGKDQQTSDLPEYFAQKGKSYVDNLGYTTNIDDRTRGMGGATASCGEENLLRLPTDRYRGGSDICIHEFAHTVMFFGLDGAVRKKIEAQFRNAKNKGLWKGAYATTDSGEYWAELSMWYFGFHGEFVNFLMKIPAPGAQSLRDYDAGGYALLDSIYTGLIQPAVKKQYAPQLAQIGDRSAASNQKAELSVINTSAGAVKLSWIDFDGKVLLYKTVAAGSSFVQPTFIQHVWRIEKEDGETYYVRITTSPFKVEIKK